MAVLLGTLLAAGAWATTPRVTSRTPTLGTDSNKPTVVLFLDRVVGLREHHVRASVDGVDVSGAAELQGEELHLRLRDLDEGEHEIRVWTERFGPLQRRMESRWTFLVDTTDPDIEVSRPAGDAPTSDVRNTRFRLRTEPRAHVTFSVGGRDVVARASESGSVSALVPLSDGNQRVTIEARDQVGNSSRQVQRIFVDSIAPAVQVRLPAVLRSEQWSTAFSVRDANGAEVTAAIDGDEDAARLQKAATGRYTLTPTERLAEGNHRVMISAVDPHGHVTTHEQAVLVESSESLGENALGRGARGADVRQLHERLQELGFWRRQSNVNEWNGRRYGPATAAGVRRFQESKGLSADGLAGEDTLAALTLRIVIDRAAHTLTLYRLDTVVKTYGVAVGSAQYPTPAGEFRIVTKQKNPTWTPPDSDWAKGEKPIPPGPDNPLGTRWMGLDAPAVGIHGTNSPASIGYSVSHGCIRMAIPDVEELFERVEEGTPVKIV